MIPPKQFEDMKKIFRALLKESGPGVVLDGIADALQESSIFKWSEGKRWYDLGENLAKVRRDAGFDGYYHN